ncbi:hypothetical protein K469DRAFT_716079 [Zopfia rhizophila CBS 207.26]|uniref:Heterokaryon incompatibility domain-containing protein n=1 Tax=Zopfia rhizophila CBS 207.26 TaxID=1314779 RepID=A0A6A6DKT4_9PEZI|nr:hypothetical protein K469DRAFT_716079 [Zopfia rhizophila CBS 207.26]
MRLLRRCDTGEFSLTEDIVGDEAIPPYAILSHTWGADRVMARANASRSCSGERRDEKSMFS